MVWLLFKGQNKKIASVTAITDAVMINDSFKTLAEVS